MGEFYSRVPSAHSKCGMDDNGGRCVINSLSSPRFLHSLVPLVEDHSFIIQVLTIWAMTVIRKKSPQGIAMQNLKEKKL
ncbi:hypothetical protein V6N12_040824 [Hibiscus sabdariffa]|uniref:Uncharacterized protein n=1 Tax=Hibiscus sabdariffa TaxID=183260 RepID=A0ABR2E4S2_9ROSI